jgi:hypothetical protein
MNTPKQSAFRLRDITEVFPEPGPKNNALQGTTRTMTIAEKGRATMIALGWKWDSRNRRWVR